MGGACGMDRWTRTDPPLAAADHVHLKPMGYERSADALFDRIMADYARWRRSEEHTSELQSLMRISYAVFCLKKKTNQIARNKSQQDTRSQYKPKNTKLTTYNKQ